MPSCAGSRTAGFAEAANEALRVVEGATFLLVCHDDVVPDPAAVRVLVEEAYRSNAGIVGPKLVSATDPKVLLEVGRSIDRFGVPYTGIEPGEFDQEQHDGVRDVFYVTTATMLVRVDLFTQLGGLRARDLPRRRGPRPLLACPPGGCARARRARRPGGAPRGGERSPARRPAERVGVGAQSRVRVLLTSYSFLTLIWLVPVGIVVGFVEALGHLFTGHPQAARAAVTGWFWNLFHLRRLRASRKRAQSLRHVRDSELRELQIGSATRLGAFFSHHLHTDDRFRSFSDRSLTAVDTVSDGMRAPAASRFLGFIVVVLVGSRTMISSGVPGIGTLVPWPSTGDLFDSFGSAWRYTGLGSATPAPFLLALMGGFGTVLFGAVGLAQTLIVVVALPLGAFGAYRLSPHLGLRGPAFAAGSPTG